jgi:hypothetical protein
VHEYQRDELEPCIRELHERHLRRPNTNS